MVATATNPVPERDYPGTRTTRLSPGRFRNTDREMATPVVNGKAPSVDGVTGVDGGQLRRRELAAFLRSRRERVRPEQVGLPPTRRRRTPGLRREEVAQLAGVGITWYTWLEQGRDINASSQVLDAIARTLQLDGHEYSHLFTLAGSPEAAITPIADECHALWPTAQALLDQLEPFPAIVVSARFDLLAFNRVYASFFDDIDAIPIEDRNMLWLAFTHPGLREVIVDWDDIVGQMVAEYRAAMAEHLGEPAWKSLVARLHRASPEFTAVWERHDVQRIQSRTKRALHPEAGLLLLDYTNLWFGPHPGARMIAFTPADDRTAERLRRLHESLTVSAAGAA
jgi:transcriptional regulator with XRE-family HTH domain